jgi:hypothetical protein
MLGERVISSIIFPNFQLITQTLSLLSSTSLPLSVDTEREGEVTLTTPSSLHSMEPTLKKQRTYRESRGGEEGDEGVSVQASGFTDQVHTRYIVPSYTGTSPCITESLPYIQMRNKEKEMSQRRGWHSDGEERKERDNELMMEGKSLCEYALLGILGTLSASLSLSISDLCLCLSLSTFPFAHTSPFLLSPLLYWLPLMFLSGWYIIKSLSSAPKLRGE